MKTPNSFSEAVSTLRDATCVSYLRGCGGRHRTPWIATVMHDNVPDDTRTIHVIKWFEGGAHAYVTKRVLHGYDAKKHAWTRYSESDPWPEVQFESKRGFKAFAALIEEQALKAKGVPNPDMFSFYPNPPVTLTAIELQIQSAAKAALA